MELEKDNEEDQNENKESYKEEMKMKKDDMKQEGCVYSDSSSARHQMCYNHLQDEDSHTMDEKKKMVGNKAQIQSHKKKDGIFHLHMIWEDDGEEVNKPFLFADLLQQTAQRNWDMKMCQGQPYPMMKVEI